MLLGSSVDVAHLYWKFVIFPGRLHAAWELASFANRYPAFVPALCSFGRVCRRAPAVPGILALVALYALPMMLGAAQFWLLRNGFYLQAAARTAAGLGLRFWRSRLWPVTAHGHCCPPKSGAPGRIRTCDLKLRSFVLLKSQDCIDFLSAPIGS